MNKKYKCKICGKTILISEKGTKMVRSMEKEKPCDDGRFGK